jgi:hypothetical protein
VINLQEIELLRDLGKEVRESIYIRESIYKREKKKLIRGK